MSLINTCQVINSLKIGLLYNKNFINIPNTKAKQVIVEFLVKKGIVNNAFFDTETNKWVLNLRKIGGRQIYTNIQVFSKPGWVYNICLNELKSLLYKNPNTIFVIRTNTGFRLGNEALASKQGGELIFAIKRA